MNNDLIIKLIPFALAIGGGLLALFFKGKSDKATAEASIAEVKVADAPLAIKQDEVHDQIKEIDKGIAQMKAEREKMRNEYITDQQKADSWNKPQK